MFINKHKQTLLTDPAFIAPIISDLVKEANSIEERYKAQVKDKLEGFENKNNILDARKLNLEKDKQNIAQKSQKGKGNLSAEHGFLYAAINNISLGFILTDRERRVTLVNNVGRNLFSIPEELTDISIQDLQTHLKGGLDLPAYVEKCLTDSEQHLFEDIVIGNIYTNVFVWPIIKSRDNSTEVIGSALLIKDKTQERLVKRSRENFFLITSHELRTPLTGIRGYIALIKELYFKEIKDEELKRIINDIDASSSRLITIINEFLDSSKIEHGAMNVRLEPCDLIAIIKSSVEETNPIASEKKLSMKFDSSISQAYVLGDSDKIKQIFINLISNAIKYTEKGEVTIGVEKTTEEKYKVTIADTGRGVPQENIKSLFSKFQQADQAKEGNIVSTGLGLYISKLLAEKMQGTVNLENTEEGKGSTFSFIMPVYHSD